MRRRRKREETSEASGELNIVPFLDVVVNVMMFLLATTTAAASVAQLDIELPGGVGNRIPSLSLGVALADDGIVVSTDGSLRPACARIPLRDGAYDFEALHGCLLGLRAQYPDEDRMILTADPEVPYEHIVGAMDAGRDSFPRVLLSAGVRQSR